MMILQGGARNRASALIVFWHGLFAAAVRRVMIYLDNAATTRIAPEVLDAMRPYLEDNYGNASSIHALGVAANVALEDARERIARAIHAEPREIVFTSGGTEANNAAIKGVLFRYAERWSNCEILTNPTEHHAVLEPIEWSAKLGAIVSFVGVDDVGRVSVESVKKSIAATTSLVSFMMVNNETGTINPIQDLAAVIREHSPAVIHTDAVQALGKIPIDVRALGVDMLSLSAHKIHGPKGIGALYVRSGVEWEPLLHGGSQERNRRGGTQTVALAVGFAEAVRHMADHERHIKTLREYLLQRLATIPEVVLNSATDDRSIDSIVNISFVPNVLEKLDPEALIFRFDMEGVAVSNGSACTSGTQQPSHVLLAMGKSKEVAERSVRISLSHYNTITDIDRFIAALLSIIR